MLKITKITNSQLRLSRRTAAAACASAMISLPRLRAACACALRARTLSILRMALKILIMDIHEFSWISMSNPFDQYIYTSLFNLSRSFARALSHSLFCALHLLVVCCRAGATACAAKIRDFSGVRLRRQPIGGRFWGAETFLLKKKTRNEVWGTNEQRERAAGGGGGGGVVLCPPMAGEGNRSSRPSRKQKRGRSGGERIWGSVARWPAEALRLVTKKVVVLFHLEDESAL